MKPEWMEKKLSRAEIKNKKLLEEIEIRDRTIQILLVSGHLDKERLEQATSLATND